MTFSSFSETDIQTYPVKQTFRSGPNLEHYKLF